MANETLLSNLGFNNFFGPGNNTGGNNTNTTSYAYSYSYVPAEEIVQEKVAIDNVIVPLSIDYGEEGEISFTSDVAANVLLNSTTGIGWNGTITSNDELTSHSVIITNVNDDIVNDGKIVAKKLRVTLVPTDKKNYKTTSIVLNEEPIVLKKRPLAKHFNASDARAISNSVEEVNEELDEIFSSITEAMNKGKKEVIMKNKKSFYDQNIVEILHEKGYIITDFYKEGNFDWEMEYTTHISWDPNAIEKKYENY